MQLTREQVEKVAVLARLEFSEDEIEQFTKQLGKIVAFVDHLSEISTEGVEEMAHPLDISNVLRPDSHGQGLTREAALGNSPNHDDEFFLVPPVMSRKT